MPVLAADQFAGLPTADPATRHGGHLSQSHREPARGQLLGGDRGACGAASPTHPPLRRHHRSGHVAARFHRRRGCPAGRGGCHAGLHRRGRDGETRSGYRGEIEREVPEGDPPNRAWRSGRSANLSSP